MALKNELSVFLAEAVGNSRLLTSHISLFAAIYHCWEKRPSANPFSVTRRELMRLSKIASISTYHKCISELHTFGFIIYKPSHHPKIGSLIYWPEV